MTTSFIPPLPEEKLDAHRSHDVMANRIPEEEQTNYETFRDCLSEPVLRALAAPVEKIKRKKKGRKGRGSVGKTEVKEIRVERMEEDGSAAEDLGEFVDVRHSTVTAEALC